MYERRIRLPRSFYARSAPEVAVALLGKTLVHRLPEGRVAGIIVETEAYVGAEDPGSHAFRGPTPRNQVMFGPAGFAYVYLSYGMHWCMNVVTDSPGIAGAVLVRALEPLEGVPAMERRRRGRPIRELCNGPGKLCQALGINRDCNGADLEMGNLWIEDGSVPANVARSTRVGLSSGRELPLRFYLLGNPFVSPGRPSGERGLDIAVV